MLSTDMQDLVERSPSQRLSTTASAPIRAATEAQVKFFSADFSFTDKII
jgi:hypothetical protein